MRFYITVFICKVFIFLLKALGRKGTSAPGKLAFKLYPDILTVFGNKVNKEIIAVMGTNGKTTTNNLLADYFEGAGYNVACNRIGANMDEGSVVAFIEKTRLFGKTKIDYACLEMDEGWAEYIFKYITPHKIIVGNLFRDQLDRYGEIDTTMEFIRRAIRLAPEATLVLNADDPLTVAMAEPFSNKKIYYGIKDKVNEYNTRSKEGKFCYFCKKQLEYNFHHFSQLGDYYCSCGFKRPDISFNATDISVFPKVEFTVENYGKIVLDSRGLYNVYNVLGSAATALTCGVEFESIVETLKSYKPQIGRMQEFRIGGKSVYLNLAKNPAGFNQSVYAVREDTRTKDVVIGINDAISDGQDISWLWDVDFEALINEKTISFTTSGRRYADMGLRLKYAGVDSEKITLSTELKTRLKELIKNGKGEVLYILANYTALFETEVILKEIEKDAD